MRAERALALALLLVLVATVPPGALGSGVAGGGERAGGVATAGGLERADGADAARATPTAGPGRTVEMDVQLLSSGDANWTVSVFVPLDGPDDRAAFEELGRRYVNGTADVGIDPQLFRSRVAAASVAADRPMALDDAERDWHVRDGTGVLVLSFTWRNFAREDGDRLVVDDAFDTESGTWLPRLSTGQTLVVRPPAGVGFIETPRGKGVTNGTLRWEGPVTFGEDYFHIVYRPAEGETPTRTTTTSTTPGSETPTTPPAGGSPLGAVALVALVGGGAVAAYLWVRRGRAGEGAPAPAEAPGADDVAADGSDATVEGAGGGASAEESEGEAPDEPTPEDPFAGVDVEMLSDEERVLRLLEANGGRMKQAQIVKETDWSNAKVSQLLSRMDDDETIDKLRIGRENLISLPDVDVDSFEE